MIVRSSGTSARMACMSKVTDADLPEPVEPRTAKCFDSMSRHVDHRGHGRDPGSDTPRRATILPEME